MNKVTLCENALDPASWTTHDCDDVRRFLVDHFGQWPVTAKIYFNRVGKDTDVTPYDEAGVERLGKLNGHFFVVVYPEGWEAVILIVAIALSAASLAMSFLLRPQIPENQQAGSPTNSLTSRQNRERLGGRIPDIYGTLWVTPDLIGVPYRIFIGNKEVEYMYMCVGRGSYEISQVRDDVTPIEQIDGAGVEIYGPNTSPNSGDDPQATYGMPVNNPIKNVKAYGQVNGQTLKAPNASKLKGSNNIRFVDTGVVEGSGDVDFTDYFSAGTITNPKYLVISDSSYDGKYLILDVNPTSIVLSDPGSVNAAWNSLSGETAYGSPTLVNSADNWEGPFYILDNAVDELWCNFVAQQGLYKMDSDGNQHQVSVTVQIEVTSIDNTYATQGSPIYYQTTLKGSETLRSQCGSTLTATLPFPGSCQVRARRLTNTDLRDGWQVVDQVQWRDLYGTSPIWEETSPATAMHFGNVTTLQTITWPTPQALSVKQRKVNVMVGRIIEKAVPAVSFPPAWGFWKLDELNGARYDSTANNNDLTPEGNVTFAGGGMRYYGAPANAHNYAVDLPILETTQFTIHIPFLFHWDGDFAYADPLFLEANPVAHPSTNYLQIGFVTDEATGGIAAVYVYIKNAYIYYEPETQLLADTQYFLALRYDGTALTLAINDEDVASVESATCGGTPTNDRIWLGTSLGSVTNDLKITIKNVGIWIGENTLSEAQRTQLYADGAGWSPY